MSATALYVKACRCLYSYESSSSWDQLVVLLPQLKTALSCRVCLGLIVDPQSSRYCQHYVCRGCLKKKRALNPGCKWCLDWTKLEESDRQVRVVLACYKLLCETILSSEFYNNNVKDIKIDNLLKEAVSNSDVLPESNTPANYDYESKFWQGKSCNTALGSRDIGRTCARENVTKIVNKVRRSGTVSERRESRKEKNSKDSNQVEVIAKIGIVVEKHIDEQIIDKHESRKLGSLLSKGEINNNEVGHDVTPNVTKPDQIESCSRSRNGKLLQSCKENRNNIKWNLRQMIGNGVEKNSRGVSRCVNQEWRHRPRKLRKTHLGVYAKRCITIQQTTS